MRNPRRENYSLSARKGYLKLTAGAESLGDPRPTFLGIRQQEFAMRAQTQVLLNSMSEGQKAGLAAFYNQSYHYALYVTREQGRSFVVLAKKVHDLEDTTTRVEIDFDGMIEFQIETGSEDYHFRYRLDGDWIEIGTGKTAGLCTEGTMTMTFTGTFLGLFASKGEAFFKYFRVQALNRAQNNSVVKPLITDPPLLNNKRKVLLPSHKKQTGDRYVLRSPVCFRCLGDPLVIRVNPETTPCCVVQP